MVRRWKPVEGAFADPDAKSRWRVHGHRGPDSGALAVCAPAPQTSSIMMSLQIAINLGMLGDVADVKNAFCQSDPMRSAQGEIYVEPCDGVDVEPGSLIRHRVNVYGLDDAPMAWRRTVVSYPQEHGFVRSLLEPCWWIRYGSSGEVLNMILLEVEDFMIASSSQESRAWLRSTL
eukprot:3685929-Pyramimonas_sp.AAC.1